VPTPEALYAAQISPVIDRVYVALRRAGGPLCRSVVERRGVERTSVGFLYDVYFAILDHPIPASGLAAVTRYGEPHAVRASIARTVDAGLVTGDGESGVALTAAGRDLLLDIEITIADAAATLWGDAAGVVPGLNDLLARLLDAGKDTGGDAFAAMTPPHEPAEATPALRFCNRLGALRHHRADAHAAAWANRGMAAAAMQTIEPGAGRSQIEDDTNRRDAPIYLALSRTDRSTLHSGLAALAD
jgi:hypothetical protein